MALTRLRRSRYSPHRFLVFSPSSDRFPVRAGFLDRGMSRKSFLLAITIFLVLGSIGTIFVLLLTHEPAVYARTTPPAGDERRHLSAQFYSELFAVYNQIHDKSSPTWSARFTETSINSYF